LDTFFEDCKGLLDAFAEVCQPIEDADDNFLDSTGFFDVPGAKVKDSLMGMIVFFGVLAKADWSKVKYDFKPEPPFMEIKLEGFEDGVMMSALKMIEAFENYAKAVKEIIEDKIPDIISKAKGLPSEAEDMKEKFK